MYVGTQQPSTDNRAGGGYEASSAPVQHGCIDNRRPNVDTSAGQMTKFHILYMIRGRSIKSYLYNVCRYRFAVFKC